MPLVLLLHCCRCCCRCHTELRLNQMPLVALPPTSQVVVMSQRSSTVVKVVQARGGQALRGLQLPVPIDASGTARRA